jgi:ribonucleoside-diphosphate reductase alpha chain
VVTGASFDGSIWSQGILPLDSLDILIEQRGAKYIEVDRSQTLDWEPLRQRAKKGIRNSNIMAIARPQPHRQHYWCVAVHRAQNLIAKSNLSGEFPP